MILLRCEFLGLIFIIIYVGAISVLFLFTVMMLESKMTNLSKNSKQYLPVGIFFKIFFYTPLLKEVSYTFNSNTHVNTFYSELEITVTDLILSNSNITVLGEILYFRFILQFLISGMLLLLVLIGVIYFLNNLKGKNIMGQLSFKQLSRTP